MINLSNSSSKGIYTRKRESVKVSEIGKKK